MPARRERPGPAPPGAREPSVEARRVDLPVARRPLAGLVLGSAAFAAGGFWILASQPVAVAAPVGVPAVAFFGLCGLVAGRDLVRRGPVLSVSAYGIFDRRLSTGWVPWSALLGLDVTASALSVSTRAEDDAALPLTRRARWTAYLNRLAFGPRDRRAGGPYWLPCQGVAGGGEAVAAAIGHARYGRRR
ncbi:MAG: hypothetical protein PGN34_00220 [Methylobacterium frigidaeris]